MLIGRSLKRVSHRLTPVKGSKSTIHHNHNHLQNYRLLKVSARQYATSFETGQPIHETRPHLVNPGDLTIGISAQEYYSRRLRLAEKLPAKSIAIIPGNSIKYASGSVFYNFQQNNDLFYLTGWNEPDSVCIIEKKTDDLDSVSLHMIVPPKDENAEMWEGYRTGVDGVVEIFNADYSTSNANLASYLGKLLNSYKNVYYDFNDDKKSTFTKIFDSLNLKENANKHSIENLLREKNSTIRSLKQKIAEMRVTKSNAELKMMRIAGKISGRAYNEAFAKSFKSEKGLLAFLEYRFISGGCDKSAYIPVVAGGSNALCIHYTRNDKMFSGDEMVLVDAAGSLGGYCADISRTWPVNGKFTKPQSELYQAVLNVEKSCIEKCTEDSNFSINDMHNLSVSLMTKELRNCGFHNLQDWEVMKFLYPHYIGHNLGLDVHDLPSYPRNARFQTGQVVTVEPGVYVPDDPKWPKGFRNIGIRIEDDVAIGKNNYVVLTAEAAKEIADIEALAEHGVTTEIEEEVTDIYKLFP
ncbi:hypothetical protein CANARDRAFT_30069 [[Candida] arabinofermentans NRRL YB-2248]|uniref:Aminopeptidase P N-terminal domain-containing protein n=1 Tax=[Candida] arabinofermentans NRRL YB-2248 TaxID=983967 RepID=A0A1E4SV32_9ASCO|nr:hypothetical protein CANARDRAFT_30069 [[Candida] arabinofermentans NRRL YB-2248]